MRTCAAREVRNVAVLEDLRVLDHLGQTPQARAAHDSHLGLHLRVGQQPVCGGPALLKGVTAERSRRVENFQQSFSKSTQQIDCRYSLNTFNFPFIAHTATYFLVAIAHLTSWSIA